MKDSTVIKLTSLVLGVLVIETVILTGRDGVAMLIGGALAGLPIGAGIEAAVSKLVTNHG